MVAHRNYFEIPALEIWSSESVQRGTALNYDGRVYMHPADVHEMRINLMNRNHHSGPEARKKQPLAARIGAVVLLVGLVLGGFFSCVALSQSGDSYERCAQELARQLGHDAAEYELKNGACN